MKKILVLILFLSLSANAKIIYDNSLIKKNRYVTINDNLIKALNNKNAKWHYKDIRVLTNVLLAGEKEYNINHKIVLGLIATESEFKKNVKNKNKKSTDHGLGQINNRNWNKLSRVSYKILNKYKIKYNKNKYDIALNIMNCYVHLNDNLKELKTKKVLTFKIFIQSYNCGVRGALSPDFAVTQKEKYWNSFKNNYEAI
jgi:hypothetical protein